MPQTCVPKLNTIRCSKRANIITSINSQEKSKDKEGEKITLNGGPSMQSNHCKRRPEKNRRVGL